MNSISVVIPSYNEAENPIFLENLRTLSAANLHQVIFVDRNSTDNTRELVRKHGFICLETHQNARAERLNLGILECTGDVILLIHPRSWLEAEAFTALSALPESIPWGCFTHSFDSKEHWLLSFTSWYSNSVRLDLKGVAYLDHCIFFRASTVRGDNTPVPEIEIFEDTDFSKKLLKLGKPLRLPHLSTTSSVRFSKNGPWRQSLMNQVLKLGYLLKISPHLMNKAYEKGLNLNSTYKK